MDKQLTPLIDSMVAHGVPRVQAIALALSINYSMNDDKFKELYGTFMVDALKDFLATAK